MPEYINMTGVKFVLLQKKIQCGFISVQATFFAASLRGFRAVCSMQMASYMITEKGYALRDMKGNLLSVVESDIEADPENPHHAMSITASLLYERYKAVAFPIAVVSMDIAVITARN